MSNPLLGSGSARPSTPGWSRALARTVVESLLTVAVLLTAYSLLAVDPRRADFFALRLTSGLLLVGIVLASQVRAVLQADFPVLRAARALTFTVTLFLLSFALGYDSLARSDPSAFTMPMGRIDAVYFTVTVFSTVGFGDIAPVSGTARVVVTIQMLLNLAFIGVGLRLLVGTARLSLSRRQDPGTGEAEDR